MSASLHQDWMAQARAQGLLPAEGDVAAPDRPWPVQLLTALGAWLAVIPLLAFLVLLFGQAWSKGPTAYGVGAGLLAAAVGLLRSRRFGLFFEQLALPLLLLGLCSLAYALGRDLPWRGALAAGLLLCAGLVLSLPRHWLRLLLGMATVWLSIALVPGDRGQHEPDSIWWLASYGALALWSVAQALLHAQGLQAKGALRAALLEPVLRGWALGMLVALAVLSGPSFMAAGAMGAGISRELAHWGTAGLWPPARLTASMLSVLAGGVAVLALLRAWPVLRLPRLALPVALLLGLAWVLPGWGACWLVLSLALVRGRRMLALCAAAAALWVLGSFYYALSLSLADKALILAGAGTVLGAWLWLTREHQGQGQGQGRPTAWALPVGPARWAFPLAALLGLGLVNGLIWEKETLIAQGRPVFVRLAPLDPRSLIQGDYMRLNFALPTLGPVHEMVGPWQQRPRVAVLLDARGVASDPRLLAPGEAAPAPRQLLELSPVNGRWTLVSDAWYFEQGQEPRLRSAAYGEFRVRPDGRALLVGLRDAELRPLP